MQTQHDYRLRAYHNPKHIDESKVPAGKRFRYADEFPEPDPNCEWLMAGEWTSSNWNGTLANITYIVPVAES